MDDTGQSGRRDSPAFPAAGGSGNSVSMPLENDEHVVLLRKQTREQAVAIGMGLLDQTKLVTAASELARNTIKYGGGGIATVEVVDGPSKTGVRLRFIDQGPGIFDIDQALTDGYTSGSGLGLGLGGARRLVDEFDIASPPGGGTTVTILKWKR